MTKKLVCLVLAGCVLLCAQDRKGKKNEEVNPVSAKPLTPTVADTEGMSAPVDPKAYVLGPEDVVMIKVWHEPELTGATRIRTDGKISLPLGGELVAAGKSPEQLSKDITKALSGFLNNPLVIISVQEVRSKRFSITGEVARPGLYPLVSPTTVMDAIVAAGGTREYAKRKKITILRGGKLLKFNYEEVVKGKNLSQNIFIENGDFINVP